MRHGYPKCTDLDAAPDDFSHGLGDGNAAHSCAITYFNHPSESDCGRTIDNEARDDSRVESRCDRQVRNELHNARTA